MKYGINQIEKSNFYLMGKNHFLKLSFVVLLLSFFLWGERELSNPRVFSISHVQIFHTPGHVQPELIKQALYPFVQKSFFSVSIQGIKERLSQMPWIAHVTVSRVWPNQLRVWITERQPIARWGSQALLAQTGDIFTPLAEALPTDLPTLVGPEGSQIKMLHYYDEINKLLAPLNLTVTRFTVASDATSEMVLNNNIKFMMEEKTMMSRIARFVTIYQTSLLPQHAKIATVDLRYANGIAVGWK